MTQNEAIHAIQKFALLHNAKYAKENVYKRYGTDYKGKAKGYTYNKHTFTLTNLIVQVNQPNKDVVNREYPEVTLAIDDGCVIVHYRDKYTTNSVTISLYNLGAYCNDIDLRLSKDATIVVLK